MPGVLTHTIAALICLFGLRFLKFKWEFGWAAFVGNFVPDAIKFGVSGVRQGTLAIFSIEQDSFYNIKDLESYFNSKKSKNK